MGTPALQGHPNRASGRTTETASGELCPEQVAEVQQRFRDLSGVRVSTRRVRAEYARHLRREAVVDGPTVTVVRCDEIVSSVAVDEFAERLVAEIGGAA